MYEKRKHATIIQLFYLHIGSDEESNQESCESGEHVLSTKDAITSNHNFIEAVYVMEDFSISLKI